MDIGLTGLSNMYYRKVIRADNDEISLDADMIRLLIAIDEDKSLNRIAEEVDMSASDFKSTLTKLLKQGLIEPVRKKQMVLDKSFLEMLRVNLSKAIGPIAQILIEDVAEEMQLEPSAIPINQAAELITQLSLEVPDEENKIQFKKSMIAIMNKMRS
jgi:molybdenum-dependent DNA-binding transcriptional regulator ModE